MYFVLFKVIGYVSFEYFLIIQNDEDSFLSHLGQVFKLSIRNRAYRSKVRYLARVTVIINAQQDAIRFTAIISSNHRKKINPCKIR